MTARRVLIAAAVVLIAAATACAQAIDWGDAPDQPYPTLAISNGASHKILGGVGGVYLGAGVDPEPDGQPGENALGDDDDGSDDEDGVSFSSPIIPGMPATVDVDVNITGWLSAWFDFEADGEWQHPGNQIFDALLLPPGVHTLTFLVPPTANAGAKTFARFRFSADDEPLLPTGYDDAGGEVEDHVAFIDSEPKWFQAPDTDMTGIDVSATTPFVLAEDFECTQQGPIIEIGILASWRNDYLPWGTDPTAINFSLAIHDDIPAEESPTGYSIPGEVLWECCPAEDFTAQVWEEGIEEGWMNPPDGYMYPGDWTCWLYRFGMQGVEPFEQTGSPEEPQIYWLQLQATPHDSAAFFGWKTSTDHWNDDAVWGQGANPYQGPWQELRYPPMHDFAGQSIDLAFYVMTEPEPEDWGDAPDPPYPTTSASNGPSHTILPGFGLGMSIDGEADGQPAPHALGDDEADTDDEDGVFFLNPLVPGQAGSVDIELTFSGPAVIDGWIDFSDDGDWDDAGERILTARPVVGPGLINLTFNVPPDAVPGYTYSRVRLSSTGTASYDGPAVDGEVEDDEVFIQIPHEFKWIQEPNLYYYGMDVCARVDETIPQYCILADDFLCEEPGRITEIWVWGSWLGDYLPYNADPEAVQFMLAIHEDIPADENPGGYSIPGNALWMEPFPTGSFTAEIWLDSIVEDWLYPPFDYIYNADWTCWLYKFPIDPEYAFHQVGMPDSSIVYWLSVQAISDDLEAEFGWKTSTNAWNDEAVFGDGYSPDPPLWEKLQYLLGHPLFGDPFALAFVIWSDYGTDVPDEEPPQRTRLDQNAPNPFNPQTTIEYDVPAGGGRVTLDVFDVSGRHIATLVDGHEIEGRRKIVWRGVDEDGRALPSGVYFYRLTGPGFDEWRKMVLLK